MRHFVGFVCLLALVGCGEKTRCETNADCNDQNDCTLDSCREGTCYNPVLEPSGHGRPCDFDGVPSITWVEDGMCEEDVCVKNPCDDDNECTAEYPPRLDDGACFYSPCTRCGPCDWEGADDGVCIDGECVEYPCNDGVICTDGDLCTHDFCDYEDEMCVFNPRCTDNYCNTGHCDPSDGSCTYTPANDGGSCGRYCVVGRPVCSGGECICLWGDVGAFEVQP